MIPDLPAGTVIPSVRRLPELDRACRSSCAYVLLSETHIGNLAALTRRCHESGKKVLVQADLVGGLRTDREGVELLRSMFRVDGVLSSNGQCLELIRKMGLLAIQRVLIVDSRSLDRGLHLLEADRLNGVEVLCGDAALRCADRFAPLAGRTTLIAGGLVSKRAQADALFAAGYTALTSSAPDLWGATN